MYYMYILILNLIYYKIKVWINILHPKTIKFVGNYNKVYKIYIMMCERFKCNYYF